MWMSVHSRLSVSAPFLQIAITQWAPIVVPADKDTLMLTPDTLELIVQVRLYIP